MKIRIGLSVFYLIVTAIVLLFAGLGYYRSPAFVRLTITAILIILLAQFMHSVRGQKQTMLAFVIFTTVFALGLVAVELTLAYQYHKKIGFRLDQYYTPEQARRYDAMLDRRRKDVMKRNRHFFNDKRKFQYKKPDCTRRIVIVGDSYIEGVGLPYGLAWGHKLRRMIRYNYDNIQVLLWGKGGWNTRNQLHFYRTFAPLYNIDYTVVGWVNNDVGYKPSLANKVYSLNSHRYNPLSVVLPRLTRFVHNVVDKQILSTRFVPGWSYQEYMDHIYSDKSLKQYQSVLKQFKARADSMKSGLLFAFTPGGPWSSEHRYFKRVQPFFEKANIEYLDLYPNLKKRYKNTAKHKLFANPANQHPSARVAKFYAQNIYDYMKKNKILNQLESACTS